MIFQSWILLSLTDIDPVASLVDLTSPRTLVQVENILYFLNQSMVSTISFRAVVQAKYTLLIFLQQTF